MLCFDITDERCVSALGLRDKLITAAFARNLLVFASAKEMSLKNARVISSLLKDAMVETLTSCTVVEGTVWV